MTKSVSHWLTRRRLTNPARTDRCRFSTTLTEIVAEIAAPEADVVEALTAAGYEVRDGRVDMQRFCWQTATRRAPWDDATRRRHIDAIAAAWARQLGAGNVGLAVQLGGDLRDAITAALAPAAPSASGLAKFIRHGQARGDRFAFKVTSLKPRQYAPYELEEEIA